MLVEQPTYEPMLAAARFCGAEIKRSRGAPKTGSGSIPTRSNAGSASHAADPARQSAQPSSAFADEALRRIGDLGVRVLVDEVYLDARPEVRLAVHLGDAFVSTNSLTKVYGLSGLRCG